MRIGQIPRLPTGRFLQFPVGLPDHSASHVLRFGFSLTFCCCSSLLHLLVRVSPSNGLGHLLTFIAALAALAYRLDGKELSSHGKHIQEAILLGPTLFPLAFAALAGRSLKRIALWRAERGTTLGVSSNNISEELFQPLLQFLEHLIGSQSLVATLGHAITLHSLNFITFGLLVLWALSPLGGQSALRLLDQANSTVIESHHVYYASIDASSEFPRRRSFCLTGDAN
jgi:hypothetical protein